MNAESNDVKWMLDCIDKFLTNTIELLCTSDDDIFMRVNMARFLSNVQMEIC